MTYKKSGVSHKPYPAKKNRSGYNSGKPPGKPRDTDKGLSQKVTSDKSDRRMRESMFSKLRKDPVCYHFHMAGCLMSDRLFLKNDKESEDSGWVN